MNAWRVAVVVSGFYAFSASPLAAQRSYTAALVGARIDHRVSAGSGLERAAGTLVGGQVGTTLARVELEGRALGGRLTTRSDIGDDRTVGELGVQASALPLPWLAFTIGAMGRSYTTPLARQRWIAMSTGLEARVAMLDGAVSGSARFSLMPAVSVSGLDAPNFAAESGAEVAYHSRLLTAELAYSLERYDFPEVAGVRRLEQFGRLTASVGIHFSR